MSFFWENYCLEPPQWNGQPWEFDQGTPVAVVNTTWKGVRAFCPVFYCPDGWFQSTEMLLPENLPYCKRCHFSCNTCLGQWSYDCTSCFSGYYLTYSGTCRVCPSACATCESYTGNCLTCAPSINCFPTEIAPPASTEVVATNSNIGTDTTSTASSTTTSGEQTSFATSTLSASDALQSSSGSSAQPSLTVTSTLLSTSNTIIASSLTSEQFTTASASSPTTDHVSTSALHTSTAVLQTTFTATSTVSQSTATAGSSDPQSVTISTSGVLLPTSTVTPTVSQGSTTAGSSETQSVTSSTSGVLQPTSTVTSTVSQGTTTAGSSDPQPVTTSTSGVSQTTFTVTSTVIQGTTIVVSSETQSVPASIPGVSLTTATVTTTVNQGTTVFISSQLQSSQSPTTVTTSDLISTVKSSSNAIPSSTVTFNTGPSYTSVPSLSSISNNVSSSVATSRSSAEVSLTSSISLTSTERGSESTVIMTKTVVETYFPSVITVTKTPEPVQTSISSHAYNQTGSTSFATPTTHPSTIFHLNNTQALPTGGAGTIVFGLNENQLILASSLLSVVVFLIAAFFGRYIFMARKKEKEFAQKLDNLDQNLKLKSFRQRVEDFYTYKDDRDTADATTSTPQKGTLNNRRKSKLLSSGSRQKYNEGSTAKLRSNTSIHQGELSVDTHNSRSHNDVRQSWYKEYFGRYFQPSSRTGQGSASPMITSKPPSPASRPSDSVNQYTSNVARYPPNLNYVGSAPRQSWLMENVNRYMGVLLPFQSPVLPPNPPSAVRPQTSHTALHKTPDPHPQMAERYGYSSQFGQNVQGVEIENNINPLGAHRSEQINRHEDAYFSRANPKLKSAATNFQQPLPKNLNPSENSIVGATIPITRPYERTYEGEQFFNHGQRVPGDTKPTPILSGERFVQDVYNSMPPPALQRNPTLNRGQHFIPSAKTTQRPVAELPGEKFIQELHGRSSARHEGREQADNFRELTLADADNILREAMTTNAVLNASKTMHTG
ncbi:hypothetical protein BKA69DRAFT_1086776 [Paraphysoderma sedebokerense]|nr:hypothetical protein BKA69DRAFT_1086776 [Paraphysoderma sedebokerense]